MPADAGYHQKCYQIYTNPKVLEEFPVLDNTEASRCTSRDQSIEDIYNFCSFKVNFCGTYQ